MKSVNKPMNSMNSKSNGWIMNVNWLICPTSQRLIWQQIDDQNTIPGEHTHLLIQYSLQTIDWLIELLFGCFKILISVLIMVDRMEGCLSDCLTYQKKGRLKLRFHKQEMYFFIQIKCLIQCKDLASLVQRNTDFCSKKCRFDPMWGPRFARAEKFCFWQQKV